MIADITPSALSPTVVIAISGFCIMVLGHVVAVTFFLAKIYTSMEGLKDETKAIRAEMHEMNRSLNAKIEKNETKLGDLYKQTSDLRSTTSGLLAQVGRLDRVTP